MKSAFLAPLVACGALLATTLHAQATNAPTATARNKQMATDLFDAGVKEMTAAQCERTPVGDDAACHKALESFKRAHDLYPEGLGALRNLAYVELHLNLVASAARDFRDLARSAEHDARPERRLWAQFANAELTKIEARIPHLTVHVAPIADHEASLLLDGAPLPAAAWDTRLDLDPGTHAIHATAADAEPFDQSITLVEGQDAQATVTLNPRPKPEASVAEASPVTPPYRPRPSRLPPLLTAAAGLATVGVGLGFGGVALSKRNEACGNSHLCDPAELSAGRTDAQISTVVTVVGGVALAGGVVWYALLPKFEGKVSAAFAPSVAPGSVSFSARGTF
jgi:hypothetical protein